MTQRTDRHTDLQDTILHAGKRRAVSQHGLVNQRKAIFSRIAVPSGR